MSDSPDAEAADDAHWLWRLDATGWMDAAAVELALAREHAAERRRAVTHVRRGLGMALNGVLVVMATRGWSRTDAESVWGRSYLDHLRAVADAEVTSVPLRTPDGDAIGPLFARILAVPVVQSGGLVRLGRRAGEDVEVLLRDADVAFHACERLVRDGG